MVKSLNNAQSFTTVKFLQQVISNSYCKSGLNNAEHKVSMCFLMTGCCFTELGIHTIKIFTKIAEFVSQPTKYKFFN